MLFTAARENRASELPTQDIQVEIEVPENSRTWVFLGTLGPDWLGFPSILKTSLSEHGAAAGTVPPLDVTLPIYITGEYHFDTGTWRSYDYPGTPLAGGSFPWFGSFRQNAGFAAGTGNICCYYRPCPALESFPEPLGMAGNLGGCPDGCCVAGQIACQNRRLFEIPPHLGFANIDGAGQLRLVDAHGGAASDTYFYVRATITYEGQPTTIIIFFRGYVRPAYFSNGLATLPNDRYWSRATILGVQFPCRTITVQHVTSDFPKASPGVVDASDLAVLAAHLNKPSCYGLAHLYDPPQCAALGSTWYCDLNGDGAIDSSDIESFAQDYALPVQYRSCTLTYPKTHPADDDLETVFAWFGIAPTGRRQVVHGIESPEYAVVDWNQLQRAIADPYGYRDQTPVTGAVRVPWGHVKDIYR